MTTPAGDPKPDSPWRLPETPPVAVVGPPTSQATAAAPQPGPVPATAGGFWSSPPDDAPPEQPDARPEPGSSPGTDGFAIAGFALSLFPGFGVPLSVIFSLVGLRRIKRSGRGGRGFAVAGLWISAAWVVLTGVVLLAYEPRPSPRNEITGRIIASGTISPDELRVGDCVVSLELGGVDEVAVLPCDEPHRAEVVAALVLDGDAYPGDGRRFADVWEECLDNVPVDAIEQYDEDIHEMHSLYPTRSEWRLGDRSVKCVITVDGWPMEGSFLDGNLH